MLNPINRRRWPVNSLGVLRDALRARAIDIEPFLIAAGIEPALLDQPGGEVAATAELAVIAACLRLPGLGEGFGLEVGPRYRLAAYGVWGFALLASPTMRSALTLGLEYQDLTFSIMPISFVSAGGDDALVFDDAAAPPALQRFMVERDLTAALRISADLWDQSADCRAVSFRFPAPADPRPYERAFGCPLHFGAPVNAVYYAAGVLDRPLPQANPVLAALHVEACHQRLRSLRGEDAFIETVTAAILARPGHFPGMEEVAAQLGLSSRSLRRRLEDSGIGYRDLVARLRQDLACAMLRETGLGVEAVAERLGYAETASFTHAFRRWTGDSPGRFARKRHQ
ncbi:AraC family transcriptional regulator [Zavarzinia compransoris]|uniref:AraC family transcriptional regulator n=1 Tax=Zavarzinia compransoris TaxID=1264899 RepID=A0A317E9W4_9PROT|nr:AraC family transcriptional regulator [Zavarzinia compransoris]PWR21925.1 AraC family transcriptional regulator [Zavarzinia compransoris]TDP47341.1 AraC family transcriptional regulator [Zavarzinia compransoris]